LQHDVDTVTTARPIKIFGINEAGQEAGNGVIGNGTPRVGPGGAARLRAT